MPSTDYIQRRLAKEGVKKTSSSMDNSANQVENGDIQDSELAPSMTPGYKPKFSDLSEAIKNHLLSEKIDENVL